MNKPCFTIFRLFSYFMNSSQKVLPSVKRINSLSPRNDNSPRVNRTTVDGPTTNMLVQEDRISLDEGDNGLIVKRTTGGAEVRKGGV